MHVPCTNTACTVRPCMYPGGRPCIQKCHSSFPSLPLGTTITPSTTTFAAETQSVCFVPSCFSFLWVPRHPSHVLHSSLTGKGGCVRFLFNPSPQPRLICHRLNFLEHGFGQHIAAVATFLATNYKHYQLLSTRHRFTRYQARLTFFLHHRKGYQLALPFHTISFSTVKTQQHPSP